MLEFSRKGLWCCRVQREVAELKQLMAERSSEAKKLKELKDSDYDKAYDEVGRLID